VAVLWPGVLIAPAPSCSPTAAPRARALETSLREFVMHCTVPGGPLDGQTVEGGGLRHLQGVFLVR
jgi:hypothetical protein